MSKYILVRERRTDFLIIKNIDDSINNLAYGYNGEICGIMDDGITIYDCIVYCNNVVNAYNLSNHLKRIEDFHVRDSIELMIRLETEGFIVELDHMPTSIDDLISNSYVKDKSLDDKDNVIAKLSIRNEELLEENRSYKSYIEALQHNLSSIKELFDIKTK